MEITKVPVASRRISGIEVEIWQGGDVVIRTKGPIHMSSKMLRSFISQLQEFMADYALRYSSRGNGIRW